MDFDGGSDTSKIINVSLKIENGNTIKVYPNPAKEAFYIQLSEEEFCRISLFNMNGIKVIDREFKGMKTEINMKNFPDGMYIIQIITKDNLVQISRAVKEDIKVKPFITSQVDYVNAIVANSFNDNISVYPNPTSDFLTIKSTSKIVSVIIYNHLGEIVLKQKNNLSVNLQNLDSGFYICKIENDLGQIAFKKIRKN